MSDAGIDRLLANPPCLVGEGYKGEGGEGGVRGRGRKGGGVIRYQASLCMPII